MSKKKEKRSPGQTLFWLMSLVLAASMVISLVIVALPMPTPPTSTPLPTWTPRPTWTPTNTPTATPTGTPTPTQPPMGPELPEGSTTPEPGETPVEPSAPTDTPTPAAAAVLRRLEALPVGAALPAPTLSFAVAGDSYSRPGVFRRLLDAVKAGRHEFLIHTGDLVTQGTEAQWQAHKAKMVSFDLPFYPVPGNHDGLGGQLDGYLTHTRVPAHYSFDRGPVHFTMADSHNGGISAAELKWLRHDLEATEKPVTVVVLHHPPFDPDGTDHVMAYGNEPFMALMDELDVDLVFAGHIHAYVQGERDGVQYYVTGGAGSPLYSTDHPGAVHHYLSVTVVGDQVSVEVVKL